MHGARGRMLEFRREVLGTGGRGCAFAFLRSKRVATDSGRRSNVVRVEGECEERHFGDLVCGSYKS